jgi:UDP-GlcNAc:undecaprenyl-phosphate GlcNAc-1-phosphate transferase
MSQFVFIAIAAGLIAFVATPFTLIAARRIGFVAKPNARKTHLTPTPMMGGVALWAAFVVSLLIFGRSSSARELLGIVVGGTLISIVGLIDDRLKLGPLPKLGGQLAAAFLLIASGLEARLFNNPLLDIPITLFWVIGICNALNFMDNMDGLAAGVAATAAGAFFVLAALNGQVLVASVAAALFGACLGFLVYNFQPALTFMGDTGSLLLGFMLAVLGIKLNFPGVNPLSTWMVPIVVLGLPIFDTTLVTLSRLRRGVSPAQGGADHTSHRLARLGLSSRRVVITLYAIGAALGVLAVLMSQSSPRFANLLFGGLIIAGLLLVWLLEEIQRQPATARLYPHLRVTFIGGGEGMLSLLEGAMSLSRTMAVLIKPGKDALPPPRLQACLAVLAEHPAAARAVIAGSSAFQPDGALADQIAIANQTLLLRGRVLLANSEGADNLSDEALAALQQTDLILIGGDLRENVLPILTLAEVGATLRRSKRARVLAHPDPERALAEIERVAGPGLITHLITTDHAGEALSGMWYTAADLRQSAQVADALSRIWQSRARERGAPQPLSGRIYG